MDGLTDSRNVHRVSHVNILVLSYRRGGLQWDLLVTKFEIKQRINRCVNESPAGENQFGGFINDFNCLSDPKWILF